MRLIAAWLAVAAAAAMAPTPVVGVHIPWQQAGRDPMRSGNSPVAFPIKGKIAWQHDGSVQPSYSAPCIGPDNVVYYGTNDANVTAIHGDTGEVKWNVRFAKPFQSSPALSPDGELLYIGCDSGSLYALHTEDGRMAWRHSEPGDVRSSPAVDGLGNIYFANTDGVFFSLTKDGFQRWYSELEGGVSSPAVLNGVVYAVSSVTKRLQGFSTADGSLQLVAPVEVSAAMSDVSACPPTLWGGNGALVHGDGNALVAYDPVTGDTLWRKETGANPNNDKGSPVAFGDDGTTFWGSPDGSVYAFSPAGDQLWSYKCDGAVQASPVVAQGSVYVVSVKGDLHSLDISSGAEAWKVSLYPGGVTTSPALGSNGLMYVTAWNGALYAVGDPEAPRTSPSPSPGHSPGGHGLGKGGVAGITIALLVVVGGASFLVYRRYGRNLCQRTSGSSTPVASGAHPAYSSIA